MKQFQPVSFLLAIFAVIAIMAIGIFIAEQSMAGIIVSIVALFVICGIGFARKKRMREKGML
ncbi:DUF5325 family protein [Parageobacillus thermoglucosidasius]|jgi:uncharacterized membrane protein|uniref:YlaF family protein n=3 Tax=Anoxybacillaceae TaxID=3120669 RepID=A0AAN0YNJ3_PARTM|nr:DUF5325 family protein [Parageobacillus thermoglucosidasius]KYD14947.1 hypothetical protein B4168_2156 [Anoxybacillus flavithermus]REK54908.1 MAG: hypothetical protein C6P36_12510 [Geobacillus sp.]AEH48736.1 hypothetical protein Geoth_2848 [Parageobacillus thermoglucosidasius C56-YS93]ALF10015.1 hypothetical protein AOT13_08350 [Parageobacillus thermoglucosidasius]ANZ30096.1 hypothetical protein BCV53_08360 [Parageobacillus thermoglucosidasius]